MKIPAIPADKAMHFVYGSLSACAVFPVAVQWWATPIAGAVALAAAVGVGVVKEVWDYRTSGAVSEPLDAVWTAAGGVPVAVAAFLPLGG